MKYAALLRGIGPGNPNMANDKLRSVFEDLGFTDVKSVISSGNILFESDDPDIASIETRAEAIFPKKLGFNCTTIIRNQQQLQELVNLDPYHGFEHGKKTYLLVTFFKNSKDLPFKIPYQPEGKPYKFIFATKSALFSVTDTTMLATTDLMTWLEKQFGKDITSRTWLTIQRILKKMAVN